MDDVTATRAAITRAIGDVELAMARVRAARGVHWVSVVAAHYRNELEEALRDLMRFRAHLEALREQVT